MDGDGQPTYLIAQPSDGAHVAQSDAEWLWNLIRERGGVDVGSVPALEELIHERQLSHRRWGRGA